MKKSNLLITLSLFSGFTVFGQKISEENVPSPVKDAFKAKFSIAEKVKWELEYENYEADFSVGKSDFTAVFDKDGKWMLTETYMKASDLPKAVKEKLNKEFGDVSGYKVEDSEKQEFPDKALQYEMEVKKGETEYVVVISESGELLKREEDKGKKEDREE